MAADLGGIVGVLADAGVEFIVVDGLAAQAHGSARLTQDADFSQSFLTGPCSCSTYRRAKRAAGRPKDLEATAELEALLAERERLS